MSVRYPSGSKVVSDNSLIRIPYYSLRGNGLSNKPTATIPVGHLNQTLNLQLQAGGYDSSFTRKSGAARRYSGLVTGPLNVAVDSTQYFLGSHMRGIRYAGGSLTWSLNTAGYGGSGPLNPADSSGAMVTDCLNATLVRHAAKLRKERKLLAGVTAIEAVKTATMLVEIGTRARDFYDAGATRLKKKVEKYYRRWANTGRRPKERELRRFHQVMVDELSDIWLTIQFGLRPLFADADGLLAVARTKYGAEARPTKVRSYGKLEDGFDRYDASWIGDLSTGTRYQFRDSVRRRAEVKLLTMFHFRPTDLGPLDAMGFNPRDVPTSLYDLLPYSWLADYVSNVGQVIDCLSQFAFMGDLAQTQVTRSFHGRAVRTSVDASTVPPGGSVAFNYLVPGRAVRTIKLITRQKESGIPLPTISFQNNLSKLRLLNIAGVAWAQAHKSRLGKALRLIMAQGS